jgi:hypothetical protein
VARLLQVHSIAELRAMLTASSVASVTLKKAAKAQVLRVESLELAVR